MRLKSRAADAGHRLGWTLSVFLPTKPDRSNLAQVRRHYVSVKRHFVETRSFLFFSGLRLRTLRRLSSSDVTMETVFEMTEQVGDFVEFAGLEDFRDHGKNFVVFCGYCEARLVTRVVSVRETNANVLNSAKFFGNQAVTSSEEETGVTRTGIQQAQHNNTLVQANGNSGHQMVAIPKRVKELRYKSRLTRSRVMQVGDSSESSDEGRGENKNGCKTQHNMSESSGKHENMFICDMTVQLSLDERKWTLKCYWKVENVVEVQRRWRVEFGTQLPTRLPTSRIRDKFEVDRTVQDVLKGRCGRIDKSDRMSDRLKKNEQWLDKEFVCDLNAIKPTLQKRGPQAKFGESSSRSKRRKTQNVRKSAEIAKNLTFAAKIK
ncbi:hypothetical protein ANN_08522 [Periplaneta americana]|uniref:DUF4817 domain-containing protein n=1 Tax=Periplaneta americana TaxID=6978 RepID=A0ABQ8T1P5_PERAM|nr:hypothetical protein ANN_08522 [Periplaneta americana]